MQPTPPSVAHARRASAAAAVALAGGPVVRGGFGLMALLALHHPAEAAVEETYVNRNGSATLKLGYARGVALLAPALAGVPVTEYAAKTVKMAVVGTGGADKDQVEMMVRRLLPGATIRRSDASDALAVAICHAHHRSSRLAWSA